MIKTTMRFTSQDYCIPVSFKSFSEIVSTVSNRPPPLQWTYIYAYECTFSHVIVNTDEQFDHSFTVTGSVLK